MRLVTVEDVDWEEGVDFVEDLIALECAETMVMIFCEIKYNFP